MLSPIKRKGAKNLTRSATLAHFFLLLGLVNMANNSLCFDHVTFNSVRGRLSKWYGFLEIDNSTRHGKTAWRFHRMLRSEARVIVMVGKVSPPGTMTMNTTQDGVKNRPS